MQFRLRTLFALVAAMGALTLLWKWDFLAGAIGLTVAGSAMGMWLRYRWWSEEQSASLRWNATLAGGIMGGAATGLVLVWMAEFSSMARNPEWINSTAFLFVSYFGLAGGGLVGAFVAVLVNGIRQSFRRRYGTRTAAGRRP